MAMGLVFAGLLGLASVVAAGDQVRTLRRHATDPEASRVDPVAKRSL